MQSRNATRVASTVLDRLDWYEVTIPAVTEPKPERTLKSTRSHHQSSLTIRDRLAVICYTAAMDNVPPTRLRVIIQNFIIEKHTRIVVYEAFRTSTCTRSGPNGYREYTEFNSGFFAILGIVLGSSTMRMLLDQKIDI